MAVTLTGTEVLQVQGLLPNGQLAATTETTTTAAIAALASGNFPPAIGITAGTTRTQAGATVLILGVNRVDTSTAPAAGSLLGDGVILPASTPGDELILINNTNFPIRVYGNGSDTINGVAGATGISIPAKSVDIYIAAATGSWQVETGVGYSGQLPTELSLVGITAGTTRTQAGATVLVADVNRIDTSTAVTAGTTLGDGVVLPAAPSGAALDIVVVNNTANIVQVYGNGSDTINGVAGSVGVPIPPTGTFIFVSAAAGSWNIESGVGSGAFGAIPTVITQEAMTANATGTIAAATAITAQQAHVTTAANATAPYSAVALPQWAGGMLVNIYNDTANPIQVFPYNGDSATINDGVANASVTQMPNSVATYISNISGAVKEWHSSNAANGYSTGTSLPTIFSLSGITAAGTTQATGTPLIAVNSIVSTVAANTGVNLPGSVTGTTTNSAGLVVTVVNNGANSLLVYPPIGATSDTINGQASTAGISLFPGTVANFISAANGVWTADATSMRMAASNTIASAATLVLTAASITGGVAEVSTTITGATTITSLTTDTATAILKALHSPVIGTSYKLRIVNVVAVASSSLLGGTGVTISSAGSGVVTIPASGWRDFIVTVTAVATPAVTMASTSTGTWS